jgi:hypothetical protein
MDDKDFHLKTLEYHLSQVSLQYTKCIANAAKEFLESKTDFDILSKDCQQYKTNLDDLLSKYREENKKT